MCSVTFDVPEEILLDLHEDKNDFTDYIKNMVALDLYKNKKISLGYCARLAGMTKEDFIAYLGEQKVSIFHYDSEEDFLEELANA